MKGLAKVQLQRATLERRVNWDFHDVMMVGSVEELLDWIMDSGGSYHMTYMRDYLFEFEEYDGGNILVYTTMYEECGCQTFRSTYLLNRLPSSTIGFGTPIDMLGFFCWLASIKQGMLEPVIVNYIFLGYRECIVANKHWKLDDVTSKVQVQWRCCKELRLRWNRGRFIHLRYKEDSNKAAFSVAAAEKIYAHESLKFNESVTCEAISKCDPNLPPSPVCEINVPEKVKSSCEDPPDLELKDLPSHLEYAFLEGDDKLPVIIAKNLKDEDETALIK
ncbi:hypothetical protein Tco_0864248, partial [Tanacetum coccineum]